MPSASTAPSSTAPPSPSPSLSSPSPATPTLRRIPIATHGEIAMPLLPACHHTGTIAIAPYAATAAAAPRIPASPAAACSQAGGQDGCEVGSAS